MHGQGVIAEQIPRIEHWLGFYFHIVLDLWIGDLASEKYRGMKTKLNAPRLKSLIVLMRCSGMRISDAVTLTSDRIDGKRLFPLHTKNGRACVCRFAGFGAEGAKRSQSTCRGHALLLERAL